MSSPAPRVVSLHLHPADAGAPLRPVEAVQAVQAKGLEGDARYFGRLSRQTGLPTLRQVSLIERECLAGHAAALGLTGLAPGAVRSNIETHGLELVPLVGRDLEIGGAVLRITAAREPCARMDAVCQGLRERMLGQRQGVLAEVLRSGAIRAGDAINLLPRSQ